MLDMDSSTEFDVSVFRLRQIPPVSDLERQNCSAIVKRLTACGMLPLQIHHCTGVPIETSMRLFRVFKPLRWIAPPTSLGRSLAERLVYSMFAAHLEAAACESRKTDWMLPVVVAWKRTIVDIQSYGAGDLFRVGEETLSLGAAVAVARGLRETSVVSFPGYSGRLFPHIRVRGERCPLCGCIYVVIEAEREYEKYKTCPFCELRESLRFKRLLLKGESDAPDE